jgi:hypothetical protein
MTGEVLGSAFRFMVESLAGGEVLLPALRRRLDGLDDAAWLPWAEYVAACQALTELLGDASVRRIGAEVMRAAHGHLVAQGFATLDDALGGWRELFLANIRGLAEHQVPRVVEQDVGRLTIDYGVDLPAALAEGYLRGAVLAYGGRVRSFSAERVEVEGFPRLRCRLTWSGPTR